MDHLSQDFNNDVVDVNYKNLLDQYLSIFYRPSNYGNQPLHKETKSTKCKSVMDALSTKSNSVMDSGNTKHDLLINSGMKPSQEELKRLKLEYEEVTNDHLSPNLTEISEAFEEAVEYSTAIPQHVNLNIKYKLNKDIYDKFLDVNKHMQTVTKITKDLVSKELMDFKDTFDITKEVSDLNLEEIVKEIYEIKEAFADLM